MDDEPLIAEPLRRWIVERKPELEFDGFTAAPWLSVDEGSPGYSEYTPGDPWSCSVFYEYHGKSDFIEVFSDEMGAFIARIAELTVGERR